jgi:hypothetical protein
MNINQGQLSKVIECKGIIIYIDKNSSDQTSLADISVFIEGALVVYSNGGIVDSRLSIRNKEDIVSYCIALTGG